MLGIGVRFELCVFGGFFIIHSKVCRAISAESLYLGVKKRPFTSQVRNIARRVAPATSLSTNFRPVSIGAEIGAAGKVYATSRQCN